MKSIIRNILIVLSVVLLLSELFYGIPFLGGSFILGLSWQPLFVNMFLYLIMLVILMVDKQNAIKPMAVVPLLGIIGSIIAFIPFIGMIVHWILFFLLIFFLLIVLSSPIYVPNKNARVIYTEDRRHKN
ncbi:hypothetical protein ISO99_11145 [Staphylococcus sp. 18_1_E_LY]|uniref:Integral membrane protein n=1 Tax=Staphylococcus lloydii TaxID=2781774 RepID=A0A7T1B151_9STAP|nr:hypothetical protein [Staphylococcus lloydii]MBF7020468.1 hypothetical protein [Staphylococcus lloydii]MBF7028151.1 hypothetical protein [Staphylococcus lloydii]QPM75814.1 hypothetical protein ISP08_03485 [Staphylococcus lloydii]